MLAEARKKLAELPGASRVTLEAGDAFNLRFADRHFDLVIVWRLLHLVPEALLPDAIRELCRVTGRDLLVQTYAALSDRARPPIAPPSFLKRHAARGRHYLRRIQDRLRPWWTAARPVAATDVASAASGAKPWSHIEAFSHRQGLIDGMISSHGFQPTLARVLDEYDEHCDVRVTCYTRAVAAPGAQIPAEPR
jgi:ubiquinone/menaquinone biosynthesis C-methylase UbiE